MPTGRGRTLTMAASQEYWPIFYLHLNATAVFVVAADIIMPSGKVAYPKIEDNNDGTVTIRYTPSEVGTHEMNVRYNNQAIQGNAIFKLLPWKVF
jgi:hypothetical protein